MVLGSPDGGRPAMRNSLLRFQWGLEQNLTWDVAEEICTLIYFQVRLGVASLNLRAEVLT